MSDEKGAATAADGAAEKETAGTEEGAAEEKKVVPRIVIPMDGMNRDGVIERIELLRGIPGVWGFKLNDVVLDVTMGAPFLLELKETYPGIRTWIDVKLKDIDNTQNNQVTKACAARLDFITVHASNTVKAMDAAVTAAANSEAEPQILGVTVLTSMTEEDCQLAYGCSIKAAVLKFARNAAHAGCQGIVCSAQHLNFLADYAELSHLLKVTPGIRPDWWQKKYPEQVDDQKQVMTAGEAAEAGSDLLVIGRPIYRENDPAKAVADTLAEIDAALAA